MKKLFSIFILVPAFCFGQWNQMGSSIIGTAENDKLGSNHSIDIDSSGKTLAFGTAINSDIFTFSGYAKVMDWNGTEWIQRGNTFFGTDSTLEGTGSAVSLSANGNTVAISSPWGYNNLGYKCGIVRVFDWSGSAWVQRGDRINGEGNPNPFFAGCVFGTGLDLSSDGNHLIVGAKANTQEVGVLHYQGHARVYEWNGTAWVQVGQDIDGSMLSLQEFGYAVSISDGGNRVAIGARSYQAIASQGGAAFMYEFDGTNWQQMGDTLLGTTGGEYLGAALHMTGDGNTVAVGAPGTGNPGKVWILDWNGTDWITRGGVLTGIGSLSRFGQSLDMSYDGNKIAVGQPGANFSDGNVPVLEWNGTFWNLIGSEISSTTAGNINGFGSAVRMNAAGSKFVIGAPGVDGAMDDLGEIKVYKDQSDAGINENSALVELYPNPSSGMVKISSKEQIELVHVFDMMGKEIFSSEINSSNMDIDLTNYPNGKLTLKLQMNSGVQTYSIVKNN